MSTLASGNDATTGNVPADSEPTVYDRDLLREQLAILRREAAARLAAENEIKLSTRRRRQNLPPTTPRRVKRV
jgi:hypothetical protein